MSSWRVIAGDCVVELARLPAASIDAVVCDPPYGLEFMGKEWDRLSGQPGYNERGRITDRPDAEVPYGRGGGVNSYQAGRPMQTWHEAWAREALRVLRPGGHLLAFGGTRTYHRLACAVEDAGFEVRDTIAWMYGSGFPKSLDVSKAIDRAAGAEREVVGEYVARGFSEVSPTDDGRNQWAAGDVADKLAQRTAPATPAAEAWSGWGTALKPAFEPIVVARKPLSGTVAGNVLEHGTGALNIEGCRLAFASASDEAEAKAKNRHGDFDSAPPERVAFGVESRSGAEVGNYDPVGRWPANVVLDPAAGELLDEQSGELASGNHPAVREGIGFTKNAGGRNSGTAGERQATGVGGASRFFYCAKTSREERNAGLDGFEVKPLLWSSGEAESRQLSGRGTDRSARNPHPTVKPIELMRWLVRLVTPAGGVVLDPFVGSGTTGCAAVLEGFEFIGVERDPEYVAIAEARIRWWAEHPQGLGLRAALEGNARRRKVSESGQGSLL